MKYIKKVIDEQILLLQNPTEGNIALVNNNLDLLSIRLSDVINFEDREFLEMLQANANYESIENLRLQETKLINNLEMYANSGEDYLSNELSDKVKLGVLQEEILRREKK
jgi:hypothetical protein